MPVTWDDEIDEIINGDAAAGVAYPTPAKGVVIVPMAPLGLRDRERGTVTVTTSLGLWKKVQRIRANPSVSIAFHAREHGHSNRPDFVLLQGRAAVQDEPDREWLESITSQWERFLGPRETGWRGRLMDTYYWNRIGIEVAVERIVRWDNPGCAGEPVVAGAPLPAEPPAPQKEPGNGTGPRKDVEKAAAHVRTLPHTLLGWIGADGLPMLVAAKAAGSGPDGLELEVEQPILPPGGRRAGLTAHAFEARMHGQEQRMYTGWMTSDGGTRATYAPHTLTGNKLPPSRLLFDLGAGIATRVGLRGARKAGVAP
jgi:hypothetical protein